MICNTFTGRVVSPYVALDTETKVYVDGKLLTDAQIKQMCAQTRRVKGEDTPRYPVSWWREHAEVRAWAYIIYAPEGFAIAETWEEFSELLARLHVRVGWWYYAPFDYAVLDSDMLCRGYEYVEKVTPGKPYQYSDLSSDFGARYSMEINLPYIKDTRGDRSKRKAWKVTFYDLRNILSGGLAKLLKDFKVTDAEGNAIRKLEMDYQAAGTTEEDIQYMRHDAAGLWWLIDTASRYLERVYDMSIRHGKPDVLTASGLAKKVLLRRMFPADRNDVYRLKHYHQLQPMWLALDTELRRHGLLGGGLVLVNPDMKGKHLKGITAHRYDVNSEYPYIMEGMRSVGKGYGVYKTEKEAREDLLEWHDCRDPVIIYKITKLHATVKPHMIPSWRNPFTAEIMDEYIITDPATESIMLFKEEFDELATYWYDIHEIVVSEVLAFPTFQNKALAAIMREEYARKAEAKRDGDEAKSYFSKLIMNGLGGKFSQNPRRMKKTRVLGEDGIVQRETVMQRVLPEGAEDGEEIDVPLEECDERAIMNVVQGALITCGGRCLIRRLAREICRGEVRKYLCYVDTDSLHVLDVEAPPELVDAYRLGALKRENHNPITAACFLAPKTYYEMEEGYKKGDKDALAVHAKGVHTEDIMHLYLKKGTPLETIYRPGFRVCSLSALNVRGGKALLPLPKVLQRVTDLNWIDEME